MIGASGGMATTSGGLLVAPVEAVEVVVAVEPARVGVGGVEPMAAEAAWNLSACREERELHLAKKEKIIFQVHAVSHICMKINYKKLI